MKREGTLEEGEDSEWEEMGEALESDEEVEDGESNGPATFDEEIFHRIDLKPNLVSRRSLLTLQIHENDRAQNAASYASPESRRPRTPNKPRGFSPRTTRRNMLSTELTESLRKHILWERQVKRQTSNAILKRKDTAPTKILQNPTSEIRGSSCTSILVSETIITGHGRVADECT